MEWLAALIGREPEDREQLVAQLHAAGERNLLEPDVLAIIEGALQISEMQVRDVMLPRARMEVIRLDSPVEEIAAFVVDTGHSRFPAVGESRDDVAGILLAKDLLRYFAGREFDLRAMLRPAVFVPESKRLNVLLREFRISRNHMAIVVDEYGGVAGLVTIEDVLEQIVGDIEDEYDQDDDGDDNIRLLRPGCYRVKGATGIDDFNTAFATRLDDGEYDTIGGLLMHHFGHPPRRGEMLTVESLRIKVLRADPRRVHTVLVERDGAPPGTAGG